MEATDHGTNASPAARPNPTFDLAIDKEGTVWVGAWNGVYRSNASKRDKIIGIDGPVMALCLTQTGILGASREGVWRIRAGKGVREPLPGARSIHRLWTDQDDGLWIATGMGLVHQAGAATPASRGPRPSG